MEEDENGNLQTRHTLVNLEDGEIYQVQVRAINDEGNGEWSNAVQVSTPANEAPVFQEGSNAARELQENSSAETLVGAPLTATDGDGDTLTYSIDGENEGRFTIVYQDGQLKAGSHSYDHEANDTHTLTVTVSDGEGGTANIQVTVNITNLNETPDAPAAARSHSKIQHQPGYILGCTGQRGQTAHHRVHHAVPGEGSARRGRERLEGVEPHRRRHGEHHHRPQARHHL